VLIVADHSRGPAVGRILVLLAALTGFGLPFVRLFPARAESDVGRGVGTLLAAARKL
jgi:hypothetical protein